MEAGVSVVNDDRELPIEIQVYFWQQTGAFLKQKLSPGKYEPACGALERLLCAYRIKDLRLQAPELAAALDALPRWSLIQKALPYVFQCCAKVLSDRLLLRSDEKLSLPVKKLMRTLHWCLMEAPYTCNIQVNQVNIPLHVVELFVKLLIPCVHNIREKDLEFNLQDGIAIWQPLQNHQAPNIPWFIRPVIQMAKTTADLNQNSSSERNAFASVARLFDIAVLKCLSLQNWSDDGVVWCLRYILQYLKNLLLNRGIVGSQFLIADIPMQYGLKKHSSFPKRGPIKPLVSEEKEKKPDPPKKAMSSATSKDDISVEYARRKALGALRPQASFDIPDVYREWISVHGNLSFRNILDAVRRVIDTDMPIQHCDSLLHILTSLFELGIVEESDETAWEFENMLFSMVGLIKLLGCEYGCSSGVKGQKGQKLRSLSHQFLRRLIKMNESLAKMTIEKIAFERELKYVVMFLHALAGCCEGRIHILSPISPDRMSRSTLGSSHDDSPFPRPFFIHSSSESKTENEALFFEICLGSLLHSFDGSTEQIVENGIEFVEELSRVLTYAKNKHENVFRKIVMSGILDSFHNGPVVSNSKLKSNAVVETLSPTTNSQTNGNQLTVENQSYDGLSPKSKRKFFQRIQFKTILGQEPDKKPKSPTKQRKPIPPMLKQILSDASDENMDKMDSATPGHDSSVSPGRTRKQAAKDAKTAPESLRQRIFGKSSGKRKLETTVLFRTEEEKQTEILPENLVDKITNIVCLHDGMMQLRILFDLLPPGKVPEAAAVGAVLDLEAPVLARAAFLLECAHFVHRCSNGDWPALMKIGMLRKGKDYMYKSQLTPYQFGQLKQEAGALFYGWGVSVARKLDDVCKFDQRIRSPTEEDKDASKSDDLIRAPYDDINLFLEGDSSLLTTKCPNSLKYLACQLLLEITVFLREVFQYFTHSSSGSFMRDRAWTATSRASSDVTRRHSSQTTHARAVRQHSGKTAVANPVIAVEDDSTSRSSKVKRKESIYHSHKSMTSPRTTRKLSRHKSKIYVPKPVDFNRGDSQRGSPHASLEVGSEDGAEEEDFIEETWNFPWLSSIVVFCKTCVSPCSHFDVCDSTCPKRQAISCSKLIDALILTYELQEPEDEDNESEVFTDQTLTYVAQMALSLAYLSSTVSAKKDVEPTDVCSKYLIDEACGLMHAPFSMFCKAAQVVDKQVTIEIMPIAWSFLLHEDQHLSSSAASAFLIAASQLENIVTSFLAKELRSTDPNMRAKAVLRFSVLWNSRFHVWKRMEEGSMNSFRMPPPKVDYILPSPLLGGEPQPVPDPPWVPGAPLPDEHEGSDEEEKYLYNIDEERHLETKERRKQEKLKKLRIEFQLRTVSIAREANIQLDFQEEEDAVVLQPVNVSEAEFFPSSITAITPELVRLIDDATITDQGIAVGQIAHQTIYKCLVEDADLFFTSIFEKITKGDKQSDLLLVIRKLLTAIPVLPPSAGSLLFNNLAGVIMYYHRMNKSGSQSKIASVLNVLWQVVPGVPNLVFKDMKQSLKKEHAESVFMVTANVPGAKKIAVTYLNYTERLDVQEDMAFGQILRQCKNMFETDDPNLYLIDKHSGMMLEENVSIRDVYSHMRGYAPPVLKLEKIDPQKAYYQRQAQAITQKQLDIAKLLLSDAVFRKNPSQKHVMFLYSEFYRQTSFPRRAIQVEFDLCHTGPAGKEVFALDVLQKIHWTKFISLIMEQLPDASPAGEDIQFFMNVINGALLLHAEDMLILRNCLAGLINVARHFGKIFSVNGYQLILPTLLRVYSHHHDNRLVKGAIEFSVNRFLTLHQTPFILQLFASAAPILKIPSLSASDSEYELDLVPSFCFFAFVDSFDSDPEDSLGIMNLVHGDLPLKPYDPSCKIDPVDTNRLDMAIRLAVTVVAYYPESLRATQMLVVLSALIPHFLVKLQHESDSSKVRLEALKMEMRQRKLLVSYIGIVIQCSEFLCKSYKRESSSSAGSEQAFDGDQQEQGASVLSWSWWGSKISSLFSWMGTSKDDAGFPEDVERLSVAGDDENPLSIHPLAHAERDSLNEFYLPRMVLLYLASDFITKCTARTEKIKELVKGKTGIPPCINDDHAAMLIDISISMLRLSLHDQDVLRNVGLQRFMLEGLPYINWSREKADVFGVIVDRFVKIFMRIVSQPELMKFVDWDAIEVLLRGINSTVKKQKNVAKLPDMKALMAVCIQLILGDVSSNADSPNSPPRFSVTARFANLVTKLASRLIIANDSMYSLKTFCTGYSREGDVTRMERLLLYWVLPLCLRLGTGRFDYPGLRDDDVKFALGIVMAVLCPRQRRKSITTPLSNRDNFDLVWSPLLSGHPLLERLKDRLANPPPQLCQLGFLGLKIIVTAFENSLSALWSSIAGSLYQVAKANKDDVPIWDFYHYIICSRSPLMMHILPHIRQMLADKVNCSDAVKNQKVRIERDLWYPPQIVCKAHRLQHLLDELTALTLKEQEIARAQSAKSFVLKPAPPRRRRNASVLVDEDLQQIHIESDAASDSSKGDVFYDQVGSPESTAGGSFRRRSKKRVSFSDEKQLQRGKSETDAEGIREKSSPSFRSYVSLDEPSRLQNRRKKILRQQNVDSRYSAVLSPESDSDRTDGVVVEKEEPDANEGTAGVQQSPEMSSDATSYSYERQRVGGVRGKTRWSNRRQEWLKNKDSSLLRRRLERCTDTLAEEEGEYQDDSNSHVTDREDESRQDHFNDIPTGKGRTVSPAFPDSSTVEFSEHEIHEPLHRMRQHKRTPGELFRQSSLESYPSRKEEVDRERTGNHRHLARTSSCYGGESSSMESLRNNVTGDTSMIVNIETEGPAYGVVAFLSSGSLSEKSPSHDSESRQLSYV